jgi:hypothetical protein
MPPDASSAYLNQNLRSREEYLNDKIASGEPMSREEIHEWLTMDKAIPFGRQIDREEPELRGSAAIGATWLFSKFWLAHQGKR